MALFTSSFWAFRRTATITVSLTKFYDPALPFFFIGGEEGGGEEGLLFFFSSNKNVYCEQCTAFRVTLSVCLFIKGINSKLIM